MKRRTIIIGGVAGGASAAARLRRLDEDREIIILEKGDYISYANCGLPYHVGDVIPNRGALLLMSPERMWKRFRIDVRVKNEVVSINRKEKKVTVHNLAKDETYEERYDDLIIATGSSPLKPNIPGIDNPRIKTLWTVNDSAEIKEFIQKEDIKSVSVIGGGFIGVEMADNLHHLGLEVNLIEATKQVMSHIDYEMAALIHENILANKVKLYLGDAVSSFIEKDNKVDINLQSGNTVSTDLVILAIGVRPNSQLAKEAGIEVNEKGAIKVNEYMTTNDEHIYAVGDVIEVNDYVFKNKTMVPLAGPANKQGRIVADILGGYKHPYLDTQASSIAKVFDLTVAATGNNEKTLIKRGLVKGKDYESLIIMQNSHATYYPGATPMVIKVLFSLIDQKILGAQIVGKDGVDKRIDTIGVALRLNAKVTDLKDLELAYAPPYSSAKDPVNMVGYVADNIIRGLTKMAPYDVTVTDKNAFLLDVREVGEVNAYSIPHAVNIPLGQLRDHLNELNPKDRIIVFCAAGVRAHTASRILRLNGFNNVEIYPGGARFYKANFPR